MKPQEAHIAIFWDYENCSVPSDLSGYDIVKQIRSLAHEFGSIKLLKAYTELSEQAIHSSRFLNLRSELQSSGVSITDCPHNNYKNVADQMIIVDMLAFAMDNPSCPASTTIMLISGDRDFAYALSTLRLRRYNIVVVAPSNAHASLRTQASSFFNWNTTILAGTGKYHRPNHYRNQSESNFDREAVATMNSPGPSLSRMTPSSAPTFGRFFLEGSRPVQLCEASRPLNPSPIGLADSVSDAASSTPSYSRARIHAPNKSPPQYSDFAETIKPGPSHETTYRTTNRVNNFVPNFGDIAGSNDAQSSQNPITPRGGATVARSSLSATDENCARQDTAVLSPEPPITSGYFLPRVLPSSSSRPHSAEPSLPGTMNAPTRPVSYIPGQYSKYSVQSTRYNAPAITGSDSQAASDANQVNTSTVFNANSERYGISGRSIPNHPTTAGSPSQSRVNIITPPWVTASIVKPDSTSQATATPLVSSPSISLPEPSRSPASLPKVIPLHFLSLVQYLEKLRLKGISTPLRSVVSLDLTGTDRQIYERAGCIKFKDFASRAENMGLIRLGGEGGKAWIGLHPDLHGKIEIPG
ncbi:NYN domain-containing protein [Lentinula detonsa]|uniref:NYN domain-containing protein n=1 Tax=Lentinula detonsa TaxID=2804962 RepID=A0AA38Q7S8_9AGAR|nr:NYN domain-containing protein [Lentinula detonsa]